MKYIGLMKVLDCTEQIVDYGLDVQHLQVDTTFDDLLEVALRVVHHNVDGREGGWLLGWNQFYQLDEVRVS